MLPDGSPTRAVGEGRSVLSMASAMTWRGMSLVSRKKSMLEQMPASSTEVKGSAYPKLISVLSLCK